MTPVCVWVMLSQGPWGDERISGDAGFRYGGIAFFAAFPVGPIGQGGGSL